MTQISTAPRTPKASRADVEQMLRDIAFALRLARGAAREIRNECLRPGKPARAAVCQPACAAV